MTKRDYADVLRFAIKTQIGYVEEDMEKACMFTDERYYDGVISGLRMALAKIDASEFLLDDK